MCHLSNLAAGRKWWLLLGGTASCFARLEKKKIFEDISVCFHEMLSLLVLTSFTAIISTLSSSLRWKRSGVSEPHAHISCRVNVQTGFNWIVLDASDDGWRRSECNCFTFHLEQQKKKFQWLSNVPLSLVLVNTQEMKNRYRLCGTVGGRRAKPKSQRFVFESFMLLTQVSQPRGPLSFFELCLCMVHLVIVWLLGGKSHQWSDHDWCSGERNNWKWNKRNTITA